MTGHRYEVLHDQFFSRFQKRLARSPEQCVRYSYSGEPLWLSSKVPSTIPPCAHCGAERGACLQLARNTCKCLIASETIVFELQLMAPLIYLLGLEQSEMDFGVVCVFVCSQSCGGEGCFAEFLHVQSPE